MKEDAPCRYCTKRHAACHDHCDDYKAWKARYLAQQNYLNESKHCFDIPETAHRARVRRAYSKKNMV